MGLAFVELGLVAWRGWKALFDRWPMVVKLSDRVEVEWFKQISP